MSEEIKKVNPSYKDPKSQPGMGDATRKPEVAGPLMVKKSGDLRKDVADIKAGDGTSQNQPKEL